MELREFSDKYLAFLKGELAGLNLTRILDSEEFYIKQIVDSVQPVQESKVFSKVAEKSALIVDVGFGGGFPLLPLAFTYPQYSFLGIEARNKKVEAVDKLKNYLDLSNVKVKHLRLENLLFDRRATVLFKAVGKIEDLLKNIKATSVVSVFFYKGPNVAEIERPPKAFRNWSLIETIEVDIPDTIGRHLICYQNNVPRGTIKIKEKDLVKVSDII